MNKSPHGGEAVLTRNSDGTTEPVRAGTALLTLLNRLPVWW